MTMTTVIKNKKGLTLESTPRVHRKYLGEPEDPHFIPSSPIIGRAIFTEQEEGELKRLCALALAHVPHSDEPEPVTARQPEPQVPRKYKVAKGEVNEVKLPQPQFVDTRTPSEASKRDTFGTSTDHSTPLTSAGITPGEPVKRPADATKRTSAAKGPVNSNLRFDSWQQAFQRAKANTHPPPNKRLQPVDPRKTVDIRNSTASAPVSAERTLRFVTDSPRDSSVSQPNPTQLSDFNRSKRFSQAELNKKLPPLPKNEDDEDAENGPKTAPLSRLFRNMGRKKTHQHDEDDCEPLTGSETRPRTAPGHTKSAPASPAIGAEGKKKISSKIRMFGRNKDRPAMARGVTVP